MNKLVSTIIFLISMPCFLLGDTSGGAWSMEIFGVSNMEKISPSGKYGTSWPQGAIQLQSARNEWESFQIVLRNDEFVSDVSIKLTDFKGPKKSILRAGLSRLYKVEWVDINAPNDISKPSEEPDMRPDPLLPIKQTDRFSLLADRNLVFWISVNVPAGIQPGIYTGAVQVYLNSKLVKSLPVRIKVASFTLPKKPILQSLVSFSASNVYKAHGCISPADKERIVRLYFDEYIRARLSPFLYAPETIAFNPLPNGSIKWEFLKDSDGAFTGEVKLDFTAFDREGVRYFDRAQSFNTFNFAPYMWTRIDNKVILQFSDKNGQIVKHRKENGEIDPAFDKIVVNTFRGIADHLANKGWLDRALYYVTDEPFNSDVPQIKHLCELVREADPRIRTSLTYDPANRPALNDLVDKNGKSLISVWIPYYTLYRKAVADEQRAKGADYWLYDVSSTCLIGMSSQTHRSIMWDIWRKNCHGYLYYLSTWWGQDATPWDRPSFLLPNVGYRYNQGDGYFFYPPTRKYNPEKPVLDHVVPTIRWEMLREGAEDYDCLISLQRLVESAKNEKTKAVKDCQAALRLAASFSELIGNSADQHNIGDMIFEATPEWSFNTDEGWLHNKGSKRADLPVSLKTSLPDGKYRLIVNAYDDRNYNGVPYSKFLVNSKQYSTSGGVMSGVNVPTETVSVRNGKCSFVLSSMDENYGVIVYHIGLQTLFNRQNIDLSTVRGKVLQALDNLQAPAKRGK